MKEEYNPATFSQFSSVCNRKLLKQIENEQVSIRDVMKYAVEEGLLPQKEYKIMDSVDSWRWLVMNEINYEEKSFNRRNPKNEE